MKDSSIFARLAHLDGRVTDVALELGYVLKAIEELSVEKGLMTRSEIQNKIIELSASGWKPDVVSKEEVE